MYKLENDVEWTENLKNAFKHGTTRASIIYTDDSDNEVELNEENHLIELTLQEDRNVKDLGFVGSACARKLDITIQDTNNELNLENKVLTLKIGAEYNGSTYYINYGNFIVNEAPQIDETNGKTTIVAYDYMIKFNKPYEDQVNYPCSLLQLLQNICSQAEVTLDTTNFINYNFIVTDNQFEGATLREVLQNIAKCAFSWARIGQDNKLYLDFNQIPDEEETLTIDDYKTNGFKKSKEYYGPINQVTYADSDIEGQEERVYDEPSIIENGLKELVIYDNLFAYTPEKRQQLIAGGTALFGLKYMPVSQLDSIGFIYLNCNDIINIETLDNQSYETRAFNHKIKYSGATSDSITAEATSSNEEAYKNTAADVFQNQQTRIIVDKANKTINSVVQQIGDRSNKTTTITQDIDGIASKVEDIEDLTEAVSGNKTVLLKDCLKGYILELRIQGNNTVFDYLYPADDLYPSDTLYPRGDSRIVVTNKDEKSFTYELGVKEVLRNNGEVYDEYILEDNHAKIIRRVNKDGTTKAYEEVEDLGIYTIYIDDGDNTVKIKNYSAPISVKYVPRNEYTDYFSTTAKLSSAITQTSQQIMTNVSETFESKEDAQINYSQINQTAAEISSEVSRKVGDDEVISKINQSAEAVTIQASKININGTISANGNFKVDSSGNMECKNGKFTGGRVALTGGTYGNANLSISGNNGVNTQILPNEIYIDYNSSGGSGGLYINALNSASKNAYIYADSDGGGITLGGSNSVTLRAGSTAQIKCYGDMYANNYLYNSKESMKKNISKFDKEALNIIKNGEIYYFNYKKEEDNSKHIGFIIADEGGNYKTPDEVLSSKKDGINSYSMASVMWKAIQEQQEEIENLQKEIKLLKGE